MCLRLFCLPGVTAIARSNCSVDVSIERMSMYLFFYLIKPSLFIIMVARYYSPMKIHSN